VTNSVRTTTGKRAPMDSMRKTALVAGILYLITFISIPTLALFGPVKTDPTYIISAGSDTAILVGVFLELIVALAGIGTALALFSVVKRQQEGFALGFVTSRVFEAAMIGIGIVSLLGVVALRQPGATGVEATSLTTVGSALVAGYNGATLLGQSLMPAFNALFLGTLLYRSGLVPRALPMLGLIAAPILVTATVLTMFGAVQQYSAVSALTALPIAVWEFSLGLYLTFKGFKATAPIIMAAAARSAGSEGSTAVAPRPVIAPGPA
jgi:uncharacterized protein DUF4386